MSRPKILLVCCVPAVVRPSPPAEVWIWQGCSTARQLELRDREAIISSDNYIITRDHSYRDVLWTQQQGRIRWSACICLFFFSIFVLTECFILKINLMLCCCFSVWLPVCSVLNSAEFLRICSGGIRAARTGTVPDTQWTQWKITRRLEWNLSACCRGGIVMKRSHVLNIFKMTT